MPDGDVELRDQASGSGSTCRVILRTLPGWFGIEDANENYVAVAERSPSIIAALDGKDVGITTLKHHSPYAAEVYLMAIVPEHHRRGIGAMMLRHAEGALARTGVEFLQVKTLSATNPDEGYALTRAFYLAYGFRPLEESRTCGIRRTLRCSWSRRSAPDLRTNACRLRRSLSRGGRGRGSRRGSRRRERRAPRGTQ